MQGLTQIMANTPVNLPAPFKLRLFQSVKQDGITHSVECYLLRTLGTVKVSRSSGRTPDIFISWYGAKELDNKSV